MKSALAIAVALGSLAVAASAASAETLQPVTTIGPQRPITIIKPPTHRIVAPATVNSHVLYLNRCAGGCRLTSVGNANDNPTDSTVSPDLSDIVGSCDQGGNGGQFTLSPFSDGDAKWNQVVSCMKTIMSPYNITVTETDPGSAPHFEAMIAGNPGDIGCSNQVAGIADGLCSSTNQCAAPYYPNAVVFSFSNVWQGSVNDICGTSAQEIAHAWGLDHTIDASDPMTYKNYTSTLSYKNNEKCGSDCVNGKGPLGEACTGDGLTGTHLCNQNGLATQNEIDTINALFGTNNATPPTVAITSPNNGATVMPGFEITATCTSTDGSPITNVSLAVDGNPAGSLSAGPYSFKAPASYTSGSHMLDVTCTTGNGATAMASATVTISAMTCHADSDCPNSTDACVDGSCVVGPNGNGGLGLVCSGNSDCASGMCLSDGTTNHCVVACDMTASSACPDGFGCIDGGNGGGVCWPNGETGGGSGGCNTGGGSTGPLVLGLAFAAFLFTRKRS